MSIILNDLPFPPLGFKPAAYQDGSLSRFERSLRFESIAQVDGATAGVFYGCDQFALHLPNLLLRRLLRIANVKQFVEETKLRVIPNVVGHGGNRLRELLKFFYRAPRNPCGCGFVHGMDHDAIVVKRQNTVGLVTVGEKSSRESMADHKCDHGMTLQSRRSVGVGSGGTCKKDAGCFLASAIGLAFNIDDRDDWPLGRVLVLLADFTNTGGERVTLLQSHFPMPGAGKACVWIRNYAEKSCLILAKRCIRCKDRFWVTRH